MNHKIVCPIMHTIAMVSDKWKVLILYQLRDGKKRFNELRRILQGVTQRVLTHQLRALEEDGLVKRTVYAEVPPRVEYELSSLGQTLIPVLDQFERWAREHADELMETNRGQKYNCSSKAGETAIDSESESEADDSEKTRELVGS